MCYKIEAPFILMYLLYSKNSCTIKEIVAAKRKIENEIKDVYVDVSKNSILGTISFYPEIFSWENNCIKKRQAAESYFKDDVIDYFSNSNIGKSLKTKIIKCIKS